jgi:hypothetical protein
MELTKKKRQDSKGIKLEWLYLVDGFFVFI